MHTWKYFYMPEGKKKQRAFFFYAVFYNTKNNIINLHINQKFVYYPANN